MPLIKYENLTEAQKQLVAVMYADHTDLDKHAYNFDKNRYYGRTKVEDVKVKGSKEPEPKLVSKKNTQPKPKRTRKTQK